MVSAGLKKYADFKPGSAPQRVLDVRADHILIISSRIAGFALIKNVTVVGISFWPYCIYCFHLIPSLAVGIAGTTTPSRRLVDIHLLIPFLGPLSCSFSWSKTATREEPYGPNPKLASS